MNCYDLFDDVKYSDLNLIYVSCAVLFDKNNNILISKRKQGTDFADKWEFPGGKVESNEIPEEALIRELKEELNIETKNSCLAPLSFASYTYDSFHVLIYFFACRVWKNYIYSNLGQELRWISIDELYKYDMPKANDNLKSILRDLFI